MLSKNCQRHLPFIAAFYVILLLGCQHDPQTVKINSFNDITDIPALYAMERDYFADQGLELNNRNVETGVEAIDLLSGGKLDIVAISSYVYVQALLDGYDLKMLSIYGTSYSAQSFLVSTESRIRQAEDLEGKVLGLNKNTQYELYWDNMVTFYNLDRDRTTVIDTSGKEILELFSRGEVDAVITAEPERSSLLAALPELITEIPVDEFMRSNILYVTTSDYIKTNPDLVEDFLKAIHRGMKDFQHLNSQSISVLKQITQLSEEALRFVFTIAQFELVLDQMVLITMDNQLQWLQRNHYTDYGGAFPFMDTIYFDGLEAVHPEAISIVRE